MQIIKVQLSADIRRYSRLLRLAECKYEKDTNSSPSNPPPPFLHKPSDFTPKEGKDPALEVYINVLSKELMMCKFRKTFSNLRNEERKALKELQNNPDFSGKPANKGGAEIVMDTSYKK